MSLDVTACPTGAVLRSVLVVLACEKREKSKRGGGKGGFGKACSEKGEA